MKATLETQPLFPKSKTKSQDTTANAAILYNCISKVHFISQQIDFQIRKKISQYLTLVLKFQIHNSKNNFIIGGII